MQPLLVAMEEEEAPKLQTLLSPSTTNSFEQFQMVAPEASSVFHPPMLRQFPPPPLTELVLTPENLQLLEEAEASNQVELRGGGSPLTRLARAAFQNELSKRLDRWSRGQNDNLQVQCEPNGSLLQLLRGQVNFNATINLDRIVFGNIRFSGGQLQALNFAMNLLSSTPRVRRCPHQFDLVGTDLTFTEEDLYDSSCIRNGLRRLLTRTFKNRGLTVIAHNLKSIRILPSGKISCVGQAAPLFGPVIPFEVRSGIAVASDNPSLLSFPGLEISLHPSLGIFVPVIPDVTVDMGRNAQLLDVALDGAAAKLTVSARVTITPGGHSTKQHVKEEQPPVPSQHVQQQPSPTTTATIRDPSRALCSVDVGRWLTRLGRFAEC